MMLDVFFWFGNLLFYLQCNVALFQMDSLPLIDAIIFSVNIYKYKTEINSIEPILGVPGPGWDKQMD